MGSVTPAVSDPPIPVGASCPLDRSTTELLRDSRLLVIGGQQRGERSVLDLADSWYGYGRALAIELSDGSASTALSYISPPEHCLPDDPVLFKQASLRDDHLYLCTPSEVLVVRLPDYRVERCISLPAFNDVHHVLPTDDGTLLVANSGLEMVLELGWDGEVVSTWNVLGEDPWGAFSRSVDYRMGIDLKPHRAHPNHVFLIGDEPWVTRFELRDAVSLVDPRRRIDIGLQRVHDGEVRGDRVYFTTVDGKVAIADTRTLQVEEVISLRLDSASGGQLGWCRGLLLRDDDAWVGFSRIRHTRMRSALSWVRSGLTSKAPTGVVRFRLPHWEPAGMIDLEPFGLNAVFSIMDLG